MRRENRRGGDIGTRLVPFHPSLPPQGHTAPVLALSFLPDAGDSPLLLTASADRAVRCVDGVKGAARAYRLHTARVRALAPLDPHVAATGSDDGTAARLDVRAPPPGPGVPPPILADLRARPGCARSGASAGAPARAVRVAAVAVDAARPWLLATGGNDPVVRVFDVRAAGPGAAPVAAFAPSHLLAGRGPRAGAGAGVTGLVFADGGARLLASHAGDAVYEFDCVRDARAGWGGAAASPSPAHRHRRAPRRSAAPPPRADHRSASPARGGRGDRVATRTRGGAARSRAPSPAPPRGERRKRGRDAHGPPSATDNEHIDETNGGASPPVPVARAQRGPGPVPPAARGPPRSAGAHATPRRAAARADSASLQGVSRGRRPPAAAASPPYSSSSDDDSEVQLDGRHAARYAGHRALGAARGLALAGARGGFLVAPSDDGRVFIWRRKGRGGKLVAMLCPPPALGDDGQPLPPSPPQPRGAGDPEGAPPPPSPVLTVAPHPHAPALASASADGVLRLWRPSADQPDTLAGAATIARANAAAAAARYGSARAAGAGDDARRAWLTMAAAAAVVDVGAGRVGARGDANGPPVQCAVM